MGGGGGLGLAGRGRGHLITIFLSISESVHRNVPRQISHTGLPGSRKNSDVRQFLFPSLQRLDFQLVEITDDGPFVVEYLPLNDNRG